MTKTALLPEPEETREDVLYSLDAVSRSTLPTAIADTLRRLIVEGELAPGTRLNERTLCDQLNVSRTPLREAFHILSAEGLVEMRPNRGASVIELSASDIRESFEIIEGLEALSGKLACERITPAQIAELKALTYEMQACHARHDLPGYYQLNSRIHDLINESAHNRQLTELYRTVNQRLQSLRYKSNLKREKWDVAMREHLEMMDAVEQRDARRMMDLMYVHMQRKRESALEGLA
ncbi:MAG: GntR family transcriptional regulator [Castellaniella sp.]